MMMNSSFRRVTSLLILVTVTGCSTMQPVARPTEFFRSRKPKTVWITQESANTMVAVNAPQLVGDSLVGFIEGEYVEIPMKQVQGIQARQYARGRTVGFILGVTAAAIAGLLLMGSGLGSADIGDGEDEIGMAPLVEPGVTVEPGVLQVV
jgi:hypothetical protein